MMGYEPLRTPSLTGKQLGRCSDDAWIDLAQLRKGNSWRLWVLHLGVPLLYTLILVTVLTHFWNDEGAFNMVDSPASYIGANMHLEVFSLDGSDLSPFTGDPGPELDGLWEGLLQYNHMRIPEEWVHRHEREYQAVKLPDGGYLGVLSVFHELHCIKIVYRTLHFDYYYPNASAELRRERLHHTKHCLDLFRMSAMCRGDVSVLTHRWVDGALRPDHNQSAPHQCVDWNQVMNFGKSASVNVFRETYIVNPQTGDNPFWDVGKSG
ncbi:hypothetical protein BR93DRAFT_78849 [Coniochaeta sp. PMI_546]|nr:hypothetical protein BR93DRAFT_78849 [Coniochaeta sp. PMI_546]